MKTKKTKIIAIINPNGGVAKSNTARTIARGLQLQGKACALVESDPQGSLKAWRDMSMGNAAIEQPRIYDFNEINETVEFGGFDVLVIDGAAANVAITKSIADIADIIIIPIQPSPDDFIQLGELLELVSKSKAQVHMLLTRVKKSSKWLAIATEFLKKNKLSCLGYVRETEDIKHAASKGLTAHECGNNRIAKIDAKLLHCKILKTLSNK